VILLPLPPKCRNNRCVTMPVLSWVCVFWYRVSYVALSGWFVDQAGPDFIEVHFASVLWLLRLKMSGSSRALREIWETILLLVAKALFGFSSILRGITIFRPLHLANKFEDKTVAYTEKKMTSGKIKKFIQDSMWVSLVWDFFPFDCLLQLLINLCFGLNKTHTRGYDFTT
jgi:hypothetical protein